MTVKEHIEMAITLTFVSGVVCMSYQFLAWYVAQ